MEKQRTTKLSKKILCAVPVLLAVLAVLYLVPYAKKIDMRATGFMYSPKSDEPGHQVEVSIKGKYEMYLFRPNVYDVTVQISGYDEALLVQGDTNDKPLWLVKPGPWDDDEFPVYGSMYVKGAFKSFLIWTDIGGSDKDNLYIVSPASTREEAAALAPSLVEGTFLGGRENYW